jgi:hypothetical protein
VGFGRYESIPLDNLDLLTTDFKKAGRVSRAGATDGAGTAGRAGREEVVAEDFSPADPQTGMITRQTYVVGPPGQPLVEELLSDYRQVSGVSIPFASEIRSDGRSIVARRITDISIVSTPLDPQLFRRPSS